MYLHIHDNRTLRELQEDFNFRFPYLRIEFYSKPHHRNAASPDTHKLNPFLQIVAVRGHHRNGAAEIHEGETVAGFEQMMQRDYSLPVQVFHFTKTGWILTDVTDKATLRELNEQGKEEAHEFYNVYAQVKNLQ